MIDVKALLVALWSWVVDHGLTLAALIVTAILLPRLGRLIVRIITERISRSEEQTKSYLALVGALVYLLEIVVYFFLIYAALTNLGVSTISAAVPATVVSAAIGFGAQKVIADFLAGFFIISEHQYGVGDVVAFDGTSDKVTGTVVRLTLRATQIRSGNGELITVPNSQTSITINSSQEWSRAVVDLELPMTDDDSMNSLADTVTNVTQQAIDDAKIREEILGDVNVLPAMSITPPTAAGLPWTVGMQVSVDVNPATQWNVQRIIRAALINEFWDRFQAPGAHRARVTGLATQPFPAVNAPVVNPGDPDSTAPPHETPPAKGSADTPAHNSAEHNATDSSQSITALHSPIEATAADVAENGIWRNLDSPSKIARVLSVGGRIRPSSGILVLILAVLALIGLFSADPPGGQSSFLSPSRWATTVPENQGVHTVIPMPTETIDVAPSSSAPAETTTSAPTETSIGTDTGSATKVPEDDERNGSSEPTTEPEENIDGNPSTITGR